MTSQVFAVQRQILCLRAPSLLVTSCVRKTGMSTIDVDIGTLGSWIDVSRNALLTFDPFDAGNRTIQFRGRLVHQLPFAVSGSKDGPGAFFINRNVPGCSSANTVNPRFAQNATLRRHRANCTGYMRHGRNDYKWRQASECRHPPRGFSVRTVDFVRLGTLLQQRGVRRVEWLKIDAQGDDFAILRDVLEHGIEVVTFQLECQKYAKTPQLYNGTDNDCDAVRGYLERHRGTTHPYRVAEFMNNCWISEWDLVGSTQPGLLLRQFPMHKAPRA